MRSVATFTIFSFLLLIIAMFLVFYRYDLYNMDSGTSIRIGLIVQDARNATKIGEDARSQLNLQKEGVKDDQSIQNQNDQRDFVIQNGLGHPAAENTQIIRKFIAIMKSESHRPVEAGNPKLPSSVVVLHDPASEDPIRRMISKLGESQVGKVSVHNVDTPISNVENIPTTARIPPTLPSSTKRSEGSTTVIPDQKKHLSYPAETLPTPVPAASPTKSWPSMILPDSGFVNSDEISPFSLSSIFDFMRSNEKDILKPSDFELDSQEMWARMGDLTDFFGNHRNRISEEYETEDADGDDTSEDSDETVFQHPIFSFMQDDIPWQI